MRTATSVTTTNLYAGSLVALASTIGNLTATGPASLQSLTFTNATGSDLVRGYGPGSECICFGHDRGSDRDGHDRAPGSTFTMERHGDDLCSSPALRRSPGRSNVGGQSSLNGVSASSISVSGQSAFGNVTMGNATATSVTSTNLYATNAVRQPRAHRVERGDLTWINATGD